jgi:hypothetical protein
MTQLEEINNFNGSMKIYNFYISVGFGNKRPIGIKFLLGRPFLIYILRPFIY